MIPCGIDLGGASSAGDLALDGPYRNLDFFAPLPRLLRRSAMAQLSTQVLKPKSRRGYEFPLLLPCHFHGHQQAVLDK